jgi:hypothetical protein
MAFEMVDCSLPRHLRIQELGEKFGELNSLATPLILALIHWVSFQKYRVHYAKQRSSFFARCQLKRAQPRPESGHQTNHFSIAHPRKAHFAVWTSTVVSLTAHDLMVGFV